jgi:hypothetical protein
LLTNAVDFLTLTPPVIGFTGEDPLDGGTLTVAKGSDVYEVLDFNFGGKTPTDVKFKGITQAPEDISGYYVFDTDAGKVGIKGGWTSANTGALTFKLSGDSDTVYTLTVNVS